MIAENGIRTENKMKRLAAAIGVALAAVLAAASLSPARADAAGTSDGNLVIDVPTTVPCALMADGTVVSPSEWNITTSGDAYIASASASGFPANVEWSARTTDLAATQTGSVEVAGTGDIASVSGPSDPADAALATTARFEWSFSKLDAGKNSDVIGKAGSGTAVLGSVTFTFAKPTTAFAVYSADDQSLAFYKRAGVPAAGQTFEGKAATEVFTGFETETYGSAGNVPWAGHAADIASVAVADEGIAPTSTAYWFNGASKLSSVDVSALDTSQTTCMDGMFQGCSSLESLDLSAMSTRRVASMTAFLGGCDSLAELSIGSEFAWVGDDCYPPAGDWKQGSTGTDYPESDIPANKTDKYTRAKTAFAVYSADDGSLNFYKRISVPATDDQFEGKTVTAVYTGIEEKPTSPQSPWRNKASKIKTATVVDNGIKPVSTANWLGSGYYNLIAADFTKLDTSNVTDMGGMFNGCYSLTTIGDLSNWNTSNVTNMSGLFATCPLLTTVGDLSNWDTSDVTNMGGMFSGCGSLKALDLSSFDTRNVTNMGSMFYGCKSLTTLDLSSFDTRNVVWMNFLFDGCTALTSLDLSSFDTHNVEDMECVFGSDGSSTSLNLSSFNTRNVARMPSLHKACSALQKVIFGADWKWVGTDGYLPIPSNTYIAGADGKWYDAEGNGYAPADIPSNKAMTYYASKDLLPKAFAVYSADDNSLNFYKRAVVPSAGNQFEGKTATAVYTGVETREYFDGNPWEDYTYDIKTASVVDEGIAPVSTAYWFTFCKNLTTANLTKLDTSNVTRMTEMFYFCSSLTELEGVSNWNTSKVTSMSQMFDMCPLTSLDLSNWDTSNVEYMQSMFSTCSSLRSVGDISNWDTSKAAWMSEMFTGCSKLSVDCSKWDVSKVNKHSNFNANAPGVTVPLAWRTSSDEGVDDSAIAPLCDEQGNGDALSVPSESDELEAGSSAKTSTDVMDATQKAAEGVPTPEEKASKESSAAAEDEGAEKTGISNPEGASEATKEDVSAIVPEGAEKNGAVKGGE